MKPTTMTVEQFAPMHGWVNRILRVDLSNMTARVEPSAPYLPDFLGARGLAHKLCWDAYPEPVPAFDPANPLMVVPGALTGSRSPYSGRTNILAFSPQAWPYEWFTRSSIGGHFGGELKRAGYDALIVTGAAETPVRIRIVDDKVSILPADDLWGVDAMATLERALRVRHWGRDRATDETVLPHFEQLERDPSPFLGERVGLDREQFAPVLTEFYRLHGWDANGQPTQEGLDAVGLRDLYEPMKAGVHGNETSETKSVQDA